MYLTNHSVYPKKSAGFLEGFLEEFCYLIHCKRWGIAAVVLVINDVIFRKCQDEVQSLPCQHPAHKYPSVLVFHVWLRFDTEIPGLGSHSVNTV